MKIVLKPFYGKVFENNLIFSTNNGDNIFFGFKDKLKKLGIEINTFDLKTGDEDWTVYCDVPYPWEFKSWWHLLLNRKCSILFCFESPLVNPFSHIPLFHIFFKKIYTWNDGLVDDNNIKKFCIPALDLNLNKKVVSFGKKIPLVVINSNLAIPHPLWIISPYKHELYPERLKAIDFFEKHFQGNFHLYGRGWNKPKKFSLLERLISHKNYTSYKGMINRDAGSKIQVLSQYRFCLCFENCCADGYISEKIIDCFKAHVIPIYYGAPNITNYIPNDCFVDFRDFEGYQQLSEFIRNMDVQTYNKYIANATRYLKNNFNKYWSEEKFMKTFLESISSEQ